MAGITTLTHLVQLQTPDLQDSTESSWARGLPGSRNPLLLEHSSGTMCSCPKAMASMMEGSLIGVEISLRRAVVSEGDKQKGKLRQNMCARLLDMLSPPGWLCINDVSLTQHKWVYCPLGHFHTHFPAQIGVRLIFRQDQGENSCMAPQPVELTVRVPLDSPLCEVIHRALADLPSGRLGSFRKQVICTLALPSRTHTPDTAH